jgi:hypothetical protein
VALRSAGLHAADLYQRRLHRALLAPVPLLKLDELERKED